jgi:hypothetical protein
MSLKEFPDIEAMLVGALGEHEDIQDFGAEVHGEPTKDSNGRIIGLPFVVCRRLGGTSPDGRHLDRGRIQVEAWGSTVAEANDLARLVRRILKELHGLLPASEPIGSMVGMRDSIGLQRLDDPPTNTPRYIFEVSITAHALAGTAQIS